ncbi:HET-domain-containing protein [Viridothelium virens]|uniref:HET-domain-containing protein n=1 Tax=Viridothelium virens TaxID=1048519 RepID=A0A6A6HHU4_VIRVR|nr:HET-domain-containing protein [Viridothelium virens]
MQAYNFRELSPLDDGDVRLLKLHCGPRDAELEGNLVQRCLLPQKKVKTKRLGSQIVAIPSPESYDALSYTWGDDWPKGQEKHIKILVQSEVYIIRIRKNLFHALQQLRDESKSIYLWVDALCINQENGDEKSQQIQRMYLIYNKADQVRVWLGEEDNKSSEAIKFVTKCLNLDDFDRLVQATPTSGSWDALSTLMRRPWFNRRWIIQEISLARDATLHCGKETLPWRDFADCVSLLYHKRQDLKRLFRESPTFSNHPDYLGELTELGAIRLVYASDNLFRKSEHGEITDRLLSLEALMSSLTAFDASDPHDIVYAILWLAKDAKPYTTRERSPISFGPRQSYESPTDEIRSPITPLLKRVTWEENATPLTMDGPSRIDYNFFQLPDMRKTQSPPSSPKSRDEVQPAVKDTEKGKERLAKTQVVSSRIIVDYNADIFEVCSEFLKFVFDRSHSLDILCRPWAPNEPKLPSWIPQLANKPFGISQHGVHRRVNADPLVGTPGYSVVTYKASNATLARELRMRDKKLFVKGFVLDRIKEKSATATGGIIPCEWTDIGGWKTLDDYPPERFWRTLVGNRDLHSQRPPSHWKRVCREAFQRRPHRGDLNTTEAVMYDCPSAVREYLERVQCVVWSRRLILLGEQEDSLGLAPRTAKKGDEICILFGCSVPVVLRKYIDGVPARKYRKNDSNRGKNESRVDRNEPEVYYEFIGECYVHGMMDGEAFEVRKVDKSRHQEFELR